MNRLNVLTFLFAGLAAVSPPVSAKEFATEVYLLEQSAWPSMKLGKLDDMRKRAEVYHHLPEDAEQNYARQRAFFGLFEVSDPDIAAMAERWVKEEPDSPYAQTARAASLYGKALRLRGKGSIAQTYPAALEAAGAYFREAGTHAERAYELAPDLVVASDYLMSVSAYIGPKQPVKELIAEVMSTVPNRRTLQFAARALSPRWGGSVEAVMALCNDHAAQVPNVEGYTVPVCQADLLDDAGLVAGNRADLIAVISTSEQPFLQRMRINQALDAGDRSPELQKRLEAFLADEFETDERLAWALDETFYRPAGRPLIKLAVWMRRMGYAWLQLQRDPANADLISEVLSGPPMPGPKPPGPTLAKRVEMYVTALKDNPYNPTMWSMLGTDLRFALGETVAEPYLQNAIVYSNHGPNALFQYADLKASVFVNQWRGYASETGGDRDNPEVREGDAETLLCPFTRAARFYALQCAVERVAASQCQREFAGQEWTAAVAAVRKAGICQKELTGELADIQFMPHDVDLSKIELPDSANDLDLPLPLP
ncbi:DUF4034 domain-containing protein [Frigidibacter sp. SD6-1]|uniref:DUF4034 domain-containing protein n=1 Tax=Frigidibacter sp. SD6-1 TaxID=3032581 RepID=UPI0024DFEC21|nr:DUF4034 domain-containing protein [Frigidibacter sp. SD6-1]